MAAEKKSEEAEALFQLEGCSCFRIADGERERLATKQLLQVLDVDNEGEKVYFLKIGSFTCPLAGPHVPCLRVKRLNYVFPMPDDVFYGVVLPGNTPPPFVDLFEQLLINHTSFHIQESVEPVGDDDEEDLPAYEAVEDNNTPAKAAAPAASTATPATYSSGPPATSAGAEAADSKRKSGGGDTLVTPAAAAAAGAGAVVVGGGAVAATAAASNGTVATTGGSVVASTLHTAASGIEMGSQYAVSGLVTGATYLGSGIRSGGGFLISRITPNEKPAEVSDTLKQRVHVANQMTGVGVTVSGALVKGVIAMAQAVGNAAAEAISETEYGRKFNEGTAGPKMNAAKDVGVKSIVAVGTILDGLETAGRILISETSQATEEVITHKYGEEAGELARESAGIAKNVAETGLNMKKMSTKAITTMAAGETARVVMTGEPGAADMPDPLTTALEAGTQMLQIQDSQQRGRAGSSGRAQPALD